MAALAMLAADSKRRDTEAFMMIRYRISDSKWESEVLN